jgi:hypothetical protein
VVSVWAWSEGFAIIITSATTRSLWTCRAMSIAEIRVYNVNAKAIPGGSKTKKPGTGYTPFPAFELSKISY